MENLHGLGPAKEYDHLSMSIQAKLTAIAVTLKRIDKILSSLKGKSSDSLSFIYHIIKKVMSFQSLKRKEFLNLCLMSLKNRPFQ